MQPEATPDLGGHGLVLDDHTYMRRSVSACLGEAGVAEVLEAESLAVARRHMAERGGPRIAVVDLRLSDGHGLELIPELKALGSRVVVFTSADDAYSVRSAYAAGASGYVLKSADHDVMLEALRTVLDDRVHVDTAVAGLLVAGVQVAPLGGARLLTPRELEVLRNAADGLSNNQIAERMGVTALAVKGHFVRIGRKLGANDRTQMVVEAMRADLLR
ncbi:MAG: two component transcriptional regulator, LuxR family [Frankiales bacterium]|nr:two component transcriptional regulator, LuxR family [Frankiales bacterium]